MFMRVAQSKCAICLPSALMHGLLNFIMEDGTLQRIATLLICNDAS